MGAPYLFGKVCHPKIEWDSIQAGNTHLHVWMGSSPQKQLCVSMNDVQRRSLASHVFPVTTPRFFKA